MNSYSNSDWRASIRAIGKAIRDGEKSSQAQPSSNHVQILRDHGRTISAPSGMIEVYADFAKPETTGGVVVLLERPSNAERTRYGGGYHTVLSKTKTLKEVARLIFQVTNGALTIEQVTVFDAFPLQPEDNHDLHGTKKSSELLDKLLAAKQPEIIISCFKAGHHQGLIRLLQHPGVGHESNNQHKVVRVGFQSHEMKKVDAFHPSFAITYHAGEDCFAKLLELQFAKAFGEWCGTWQEASWMDEVRHSARVRNYLLTKTTTRTGAVVSMPAEHLTKQEIERIASRMAAIRLFDTPRAGSPAGITIGTGGLALRIPQSFLDRAKPLRSETGPRTFSGTRA